MADANNLSSAFCTAVTGTSRLSLHFIGISLPGEILYTHAN